MLQLLTINHPLPPQNLVDLFLSEQIKFPVHQSIQMQPVSFKKIDILIVCLVKTTKNKSINWSANIHEYKILSDESENFTIKWAIAIQNCLFCPT